MVATNSLNINGNGVVSYNNTTGVFSESALTQYDILLGGASNAIVSVSPSTAGLVLTSNGVSANPTFQALPTAMQVPYINVTGATQVMAINSFYLSNAAASLVVFTPPATCAVGTVFAIGGAGPGGWSLDLVTNSQTFHYGNTTGTTAVASNNQYDAIQFVCSVADTTFVLVDSVGNPNVT